MAPFTVNPGRVDPYKGFKFAVIWDGRAVAGVSRVSPLRRMTDVVTHRDGRDPSTQRKSPGLTRYEAVTLERGLTHDTAFEDWANRVHRPGHEIALGAFRKDVRIELRNEAGQVVMAWTLLRAWVSEYQALPELDAASRAVAIERLTLEIEGWERDTAVTEPVEPKDA